MDFGLLKSKIETKLVESYKTETFTENVKMFSKLVLEDSKISEMYHLYEEIYKQNGYTNDFAKEFLWECVSRLKSITPNTKKLKEISNWVSDTVCENLYKEADIVLSKNNIIIEDVIKSKNFLQENLTKNATKSDKVIKIPLEKMVEVANNTVNEYLKTITESELKEVKKYASLNQDQITNRYEILSEVVIEKLESLLESSDEDTKGKINETIEKIKTENVNSVSLYRMKVLNETL